MRWCPPYMTGKSVIVTESHPTKHTRFAPVKDVLSYALVPTLHDRKICYCHGITSERGKHCFQAVRSISEL
jgi:hypothetical protein